MPDELIIGFNPMLPAQRVALLGRSIRTSLFGVGIGLVICLWVFIWQRQSLSGTMIIWLFVVGLGYPLILVLITVIRWAHAKSALASVGPTVAARIDRQGVWLQGAFLAWPAISQIVARSRRFSMSPLLRIVGTGGEQYQLDLGQLDVMPGTIDASIRTFSGGRQRIDTSKLGN